MRHYWFIFIQFLIVSVFDYVQFITKTRSPIMVCTLNESFLFDWGCLVSNSNRSNNPIAKMELVYVAMLFLTHSCSLLVFLTQPGWKVVPLLSFLSHNWWTVATHSDCTVIKLNSADVQTAKVQTMWLNIFYKTINYHSSACYAISKRTERYNEGRGYTLSVFVGLIVVIG